ncbi:MAG: Asp-tRNA(Asn)/Glu-tRNA(Gln) amidotransferase subunit GatC [Clostridiales bacterium]|jgi:aspartyl-tRNA(Asn)/glutamyl-tRNA(Gln) amidotransferase subunit C|nr:Asp-tRNA(Asn)/Glu-tRNA(Gln) amidotransferase subunit GatC [Clostridiales bacterium]
MENIKNLEALAKLDLPEEDRQMISKRGDVLLESFGALSAVDTGGVEPMYTPLDVCNVLREDVCAKNISREALLSNAPMRSDGFFQTPKTI